MLTDGRWTYIWRSHTGREHLFDLAVDPNEQTERVDTDELSDLVIEVRQRLIKILADRPEAFVQDGRLVSGRPYPAIEPAHELKIHLRWLCFQLTQTSG